jgi:aminoglycoside N3'-acetyltransferase
VAPAALTVEDLADALARLGVRAGESLMVHASLRRIGPVDGRAAGVVAALDRALGPDGTWMMTLGAADDWSWVNERPEDERPALLADAVPFDVLETPADEDIGVLAEVFRTTPGTIVSDHPEGRMGARGRLATAFMADVPWDHYYGPGSPLDRLVGAAGRVLRLGADLDTVTLLHFAEYLVELPDKRRVRRHRMVETPHGPRLRVVECLDDSDGIVERDDAEDYFATILRDYLATDRAVVGTIGGAAAELLDGPDLVAFAVEWMAANLVP